MREELRVRLPEGVDSLERLLHRCHRDELLPLATLLKVDPRPFGLGDLARLLSRTLRRASSHHGKNLLLRRGAAPAYEEILGEIAGRTPQPDEVEGLESELLRAWARDRTGEAREALWKDLGLEGPAPATGTEIVAEAERRLGPGFVYKLSGAVAKETGPGLGEVVGYGTLGCLVRFVPILDRKSVV